MVDDGLRFSASATAVINVNHVNHPPTSTSTSASLLEDGSVIIALPGSDIDGDVITANILKKTNYVKIFLCVKVVY